VTIKSCAECGKLRTSECVDPDSCISHGHKLFRRGQLHDRCIICGAKLVIKRTDPVESRNTIKDLVCSDPDCQAWHKQYLQTVLWKKETPP
jgi:hypothetical protein